MKSRRWVIVLTIVLLLIMGISRLLWQYFAIDERIRTTLLAEIQPYINGRVTIETLELGLQSVHLKNVAVHWQTQPYSFHTRDLHLGFSLINFIKYNFSPLHLFSEVVIENPRFEIKRSPLLWPSTNESAANTLNLAHIQQNYLQRLINFKFVGRVVINKGEIVVVDSSKKEATLVSNLDGWINTEDLAHANVRATGKLFDSKNYNLNIRGSFDILKGKLGKLEITLADYNLATTIPVNLPQNLTTRRGVVSGKFLLTEHTDKGQSYLDLSGYFHISDAEIELLGGRWRLHNVNYDATIRNWNLNFNKAVQYLDNNEIKLQGSIDNLLNPRYNLFITADTLDLMHLLENFNIPQKQLASGSITLEMAITNPSTQPQIGLKVSSPAIRFNNHVFRRVSVEAVYRNSILKLQKLHLFNKKLVLFSEGTIDLRDVKPQLRINYHIRGNLLPHLSSYVSKNIQTIPVNINGKISGTYPQISNQGQISLWTKTTKQDSILFSGSIAYKNNELETQLTCATSPTTLNFQCDFSKKRPELVGNLQRLGGKLWQVVPLPFQKHFANTIEADVTVKGEFSDLHFTIITRRKQSTLWAPNLFQIKGRLRSPKKNLHHLKANITYYPDTGEVIPGKIDIVFTPQTIQIKKYQLGDFYQAEGRLSLQQPKNIKANFQINRAELTYIFDGLLLESSFPAYGKVSGQIDITGTLAKPQVDGKITLKEGIFHGYGYYTGNLRFNVSQSVFALGQFDLYREGEKILIATGNVNIPHQQLQLSFQGNDVDVSSLMRIFSSKINFLQGRTNFSIDVNNHWKNPDIYGEITIRQGRIFFIEFDQLQAQVGKTALVEQNTIDSTEIGPGVQIRSFTLTRNKKYNVEGSGFLPFSGKQDLNLQMSGKGDILTLLLDNVSFFKKITSQSTFTWGIGGTYDDIVFTKGKVKISNGTLELETVAKQIDQIRGEVTLEAENQFLHFRDFTAKINGSPVQIATYWGKVPAPGSWDPLFIQSWGLNFGIIGIESIGKDVRLHIPGLMKPHEEGCFGFKGRAPQEKFYIAGPAENPVVRGRIYLHDARITYPFLKVKTAAESSKKPSTIESILTSLNWDVEVIPEKNVHYVKRIPGLLDNVLVNLAIDTQVSRLKFSGIIADNSFRIEGTIESTRGNIEYLDLDFSVEKFGAEFDRSDIYPVVYGRARTTITDSTGFPYNIFLTLYTYDKRTHEEYERGRWGEDMRFRLSSDNPNIGSNEGQILAALGYSIESLRNRTADLLATSTDNLLFRPLFRPLERRLERKLGLDVIRVRSRFARNLLDWKHYSDIQFDPRYLIFRKTEVILGKYLSNNLYLLYSGQLEAGLDPRYQEKGIGLKHTFDLEYRISPTLLLQVQYNYDSLLLLQKEDTRIQIRHSFVF